MIRLLLALNQSQSSSSKELTIKMSLANTPTTNFIRYVLPRFPVMLPQAAKDLFRDDQYFQHLITLLNELFIIPVQIYAGVFGLSPTALEVFESRPIKNHYETILIELQLRILTGIYLLQRDNRVEAKPHIDRAIALVLEHKKRYYLCHPYPWQGCLLYQAFILRRMASFEWHI